MKPSQETLDEIKKAWGDWEFVHVLFDSAIRNRLRELDSEYVDALEEAVKGADFWYA